MKLDWTELPDGRQMAVTEKGTYFLHHDPTVEDGNPWVLSFESTAPKEAI